MAGIVEDVLSKEQQSALTPAGIVASLLEGNKRYMKGELTERKHTSQIPKAEGGQNPEAIILSCVDSRVPVETVFDRGIGDLFVARVAGNFINVDMLGSMEYACKVAGSKLVMVLGHQHCGAVTSAVKDVKLGNITDLLSKITPAVEAARAATSESDTSGDNGKFVHEVCEHNVRLNVEGIRERSAILKEMEDAGEIAIVGAIYNLSDGSVDIVVPAK